MRMLIVATLLAAVALPAMAGSVNGYTRKDGTYVQPYQRSDSNSTVNDNYSHKGNVNPYTGQNGTNYDRTSPSSNYYGTTPKTNPYGY